MGIVKRQGFDETSVRRHRSHLRRLHKVRVYPVTAGVTSVKGFRDGMPSSAVWVLATKNRETSFENRDSLGAYLLGFVDETVRDTIGTETVILRVGGHELQVAKIYHAPVGEIGYKSRRVEFYYRVQA